jgi:anti-sigma-K factor RskA
MKTRYENPVLQDRLAADYVMGNMHGQARHRLEKLILEYPSIQMRVAEWAEYLNHINHDVDPITPPQQIWDNISQSIDAARSPNRVKKWPWLNMSAYAAVLVLSITLVYNLPIQQPQQHVVVVNNKKEQPVWIIKSSVKSKRIMVKTIKQMSMPENQVCVLWLVWKDGKTQSIGVLSDDPGERTMMLPPVMTHKPELADIAVSIENMNSSMESPGGNVVFKGPWIEL